MANKYFEAQLLHSAARTTSTNNRTNYIDLSPYDEICVVLKASAKTGTSPTLIVTLETYDPTTDTWSTIITFTTLTDIGTERKVLSTGVGGRCAAAWVIGGTETPGYTFLIGLIAKGT